MRALRFAVGLALVGCTDSGPETIVDVGSVLYDRDTPLITVPSTASVNEPAHVTILTTGGGCTTAESTEIVATDAGFTVTPYDRYEIPGPGEGCTADLRTLDHSVDITFSHAGTATVVVRVREPVGRSLEEVAVPMSVDVQ